MRKIETALKEVLILEPDIFGDDRGWFSETYNKEKLLKLEINIDFIQDNHSFSSKKGTLRGIHFQVGISAQTKLVRCIRGKVLDVAVDLRRNSETFGKWISVELSEGNKRQLFIPRGFGHGFITLTDDCEFVYKVDNYYSKDNDRSLLWNDKSLNIDWQVDNPHLSDKDKFSKSLSDIGELF